MHTRVCVPRREQKQEDGVGQTGGGGGMGTCTPHWLSGLVGRTHCPVTGDLKLEAGLVFFSMLHCMSEQRSEAHFYTLLGRLPCQSSPCWHWNGFLLLESRHTVPENRYKRYRYKSPLSATARKKKKGSAEVVMVQCLPVFACWVNSHTASSSSVSFNMGLCSCTSTYSSFEVNVDIQCMHTFCSPPGTWLSM